MDAFLLVFMADCQFGCHAAFSGIPPDGPEGFCHLPTTREQ